MSALVDVNVVLPLLMPQHRAHAAAREWLSGQSIRQVYWAWPTQLGVLRLLSQPKVMGAGTLAPERALQVWNELTDATRLQPVKETPPALGQHLLRLVTGRSPTPNLWTDAWLAALAISLDLEMITFDQGFRSFERLKLKLLQS